MLLSFCKWLVPPPLLSCAKSHIPVVSSQTPPLDPVYGCASSPFPVLSPSIIPTPPPQVVNPFETVPSPFGNPLNPRHPFGSPCCQSPYVFPIGLRLCKPSPPTPPHFGPDWSPDCTLPLYHPPLKTLCKPCARALLASSPGCLEECCFTWLPSME